MCILFHRKTNLTSETFVWFLAIVQHVTIELAVMRWLTGQDLHKWCDTCSEAAK